MTVTAYAVVEHDELVTLENNGRTQYAIYDNEPEAQYVSDELDQFGGMSEVKKVTIIV